MDRRRWIGFAAGIAAIAAGHAIGQVRPRLRRVVLFAYFLSPAAVGETHKRLETRLAELGFRAGEVQLTIVDGREAPGGVEALAREVVASHPDVICVASSDWTLVFMRLTREIPIVFTNVADPVRTGLVASLQRPGGNVTGVTNRFFELQGKRLELVKEIRPEARRVAVVHPEGPTVELVLRESGSAAERLGLAVVPVILPFRPPKGAVVAALREAKVHAGVFTLGPESIDAEILQFLERSSLLAVFSDNTLVEAGALVSLGERRPGPDVRAIELAARILRGESPATIPVDQLSKFHLALNLRTARAMGLSIPQSVRVRADQVIE